MKATQQRQEIPDVPMRECHVCGKKSHPYHYIKKGDGHVCSKSCSQTYEAKRYMK